MSDNLPLADTRKDHMKALALRQSTTLTVAPELAEAARKYVAAATSENTRRAYRQQWAAFVKWCEAGRYNPLPASPEVLALYLSSLAQRGLKVATIEQASAAIASAHRMKNHPSPREGAAARSAMRGIRRTLGVAPREASPVLAGHLRDMLAALPASLVGIRDRALLLVGFAGAFRRSELVGLTVADVEFQTEGLAVTLRRSKTDQEGVGRVVALPYSGTPDACPVRALKAWLEASRITTGPVFREVSRHGFVSPAALTGRSVARIVKRTAGAAGLAPELYSGHSLRAGFVTQAKLKRKDESAIMRQTGHKSVTMLRRYERRAELWTDNAAAGLLD